MEHTSKALKEKAYDELKEFLIIASYLWLIFGLLEQYKSAILQEEHIQLAAHGLALINALALGKVFLIVKQLPLGKRFNTWPLIYPTVVKSALFTLILAGFRILEGAVVGSFHHESFRQSMADLAGGTVNGILTLSLLLFVILIPFVVVMELQRVFGRQQVAEVFLGSHIDVEQPKHAA